MAVSWVVQAGGVELALGALSGWVIALSVDRPDVGLGHRAVGRPPRRAQARRRAQPGPAAQLAVHLITAG
ncbi:MAG TPA: hypothetical protein VIL49_12200 [Capillimicrobium sp.]|jgi:hypothetical protein